MTAGTHTRILAISLLVVAIVGCSSSGPTPTPFPSEPMGTAGAPTSGPSAPTASTAPDAAFVVDAALLEVLPQEVDGTSLEPAQDVAAGIAADPALARSASAIAVGLYARPEPSGTDDLAIANVIRLRAGVFSDAFFRTWRDTYDSGACEPAGGVSGRAEADIRGVHTFIGSCAAGVLTYHVHLTSPDVLVSVTALGNRRLGELVIAGLGG